MPERFDLPDAGLPPSSPLRAVVAGVFAFPPNRETLGGTAYFIQQPEGNILVDCPAWTEAIATTLQTHGGVRWLFLTHRDAIAQVKAIQRDTSCEVIIQEQEAYLLPRLEVTPFQQDWAIAPRVTAIWTPGHTPGSSCLYHAAEGGILFTGRHLLPNQHGQAMPLRIAKTFHWGRQLRSVQRLRDRFSGSTLHYLCPGANLGFLRGQRAIAHAYDHLAQLDLEAMQQMQPIL